MEADLAVSAEPSLFAASYAELAGLNCACADECGRSKSARKKKEAAARRMLAREEKLGFVQHITYSLATGGREPKISRGGPFRALFLWELPDMPGYAPMPVMAEELANPESVDSDVRVKPLAEVLYADCPGCEKKHPVIQLLRELAPSGEMQEVRVLLCPAGKEMEVITISRKIR